MAKQVFLWCGSNAYPQPLIGRCGSFVWRLSLTRFHIVCANSVCCGETAWMCRLAWAFTIRLGRRTDMFLWRNKQNYPLIITKNPPYLLCDKNPFLIVLMSQFIYWCITCYTGTSTKDVNTADIFFTVPKLSTLSVNTAWQFNTERNTRKMNAVFNFAEND